ncbi:acyl-CoA N-acyltransferase [Cokeromyces recurvatus]|uniref:acyl-CoA N-acyltransferase n=1 Tax=Cokeromyces recurvatus TaxID=90255 RepID=UPI00222038FE|nr:acyl-CoA N-acyltransferase [Cokeromyces recurvatus]KAI7902901.1 acyl-CoA N-acyltransferase [Cokeromyces recurvatus]
MPDIIIKQLTIKDISLSNSIIIDQLLSLLKQLSSSSSITSQTILDAIQNPNLTLLVATWDEQIVGTASMITLACMTGVRVHLEDVVVDSHFRGKGVATLLVNNIIERAKKIVGAKTLDLTSRPEREAANRLYRNLGFLKRDTNVYRLNLQ